MREILIFNVIATAVSIPYYMQWLFYLETCFISFIKMHCYWECDPNIMIIFAGAFLCCDKIQLICSQIKLRFEYYCHSKILMVSKLQWNINFTKKISVNQTSEGQHFPLHIWQIYADKLFIVQTKRVQRAIGKDENW